MAVLIPEAAEAVAGGEAAVSGAGAASAGRTAAGGLPAPAARPGAAKPQKPQAAAKSEGKGKSKGKGGVLAGGGKGGRKSIGAGRYQPVILAEFLLAVLVISIPPLAKGGDKTAQAKSSPSPYSTDTLKQLIAAGVVYFILALMSGSKKLGKFSAWFGGLTLLGIGLLQTANGDLQALFQIFGSGGAPDAATQAKAGQAVSGAIAGALGDGGDAVVSVPDATGLFPTIQPGGQIVTRSVVTPPPGGTGVTTTTGSDQGANLA